MIVMRGNEPRWVCDSCYSDIWSTPAVLYTPATVRNHFPSVMLCCSKACEAAAARRLTAGHVMRMSWDAFLHGLQESMADATTD